MDASDDAAAKRAIEYAITIFHALRTQTKNISDAMAVTSAMLRVLVDRFPDLAEKYERYHKEALQHSPLAETTRAMCAQYDDIVKQLEKLKE
jgi:hypothetical protein